MHSVDTGEQANTGMVTRQEGDHPKSGTFLSNAYESMLNVFAF